MRLPALLPVLALLAHVASLASADLIYSHVDGGRLVTYKAMDANADPSLLLLPMTNPQYDIYDTWGLLSCQANRVKCSVWNYGSQRWLCAPTGNQFAKVSKTCATKLDVVSGSQGLVRFKDPQSGMFLTAVDGLVMLKPSSGGSNQLWRVYYT
ncbi:hypothetical protein BGZ74_004283 [Mortierella antarctica]|nr:hypothetical protein BGZ74_004283 [Mortierella antarctica]